MSKDIAVLGAGSWGTALAISLAGSGHRVCLWARRPEAAAFMRAERHNRSYLPGAEIPASVEITSDMAAAAAGRAVWVFATPSQAVREAAQQVAHLAGEDVYVVSVAKGIENGTLHTTTQVLHEVLGAVPKAHIGVLYGPSHAEEVAVGSPTTVVAAAYASETAHVIQETFMTNRLRVYRNEDVIGVEIAGSVKNVMAIGAGISDGLGYGDNAKAAIVTRGLAEIKRLGLAMGAESGTFAGLAGIGDLVVTCWSRHSRNRFLGEQIGRGAAPEEAQAAMQMIAEGVRTTASAHQLARKYHIEMPITEAVHAILFEGKKPQIAVDELMSRSAKREDWMPDFLQD